jgi:Tfp pilus assembly protein PilZ
MNSDRLPLSTTDLNRQIAIAVQQMSEDEKRNILSLLNESTVGEKRQRYRKYQRIKTRLEHENRADSGIIENLSPNGAFLITHHPSPPGSEILLSFPILNFEFPVQLKAEVIWITPRGMGVRFKPNLSLSCRLAEQKLADAMRLVHPEA